MEFITRQVSPGLMIRQLRTVTGMWKRSAKLLSGALYMSLVTPEIVTGISLLAFFQWTFRSLHWRLGLHTVIAAHVASELGLCGPNLVIPTLVSKAIMQLVSRRQPSAGVELHRIQASEQSIQCRRSVGSFLLVEWFDNQPHALRLAQAEVGAGL